MFVLFCLNDLKFSFVSRVFNRMVIILIYLLQNKRDGLPGKN